MTKLNEKLKQKFIDVAEGMAYCREDSEREQYLNETSSLFAAEILSYLASTTPEKMKLTPEEEINIQREFDDDMKNWWDLSSEYERSVMKHSPPSVETRKLDAQWAKVAPILAAQQVQLEALKRETQQKSDLIYDFKEAFKMMEKQNNQDKARIKELTLCSWCEGKGNVTTVFNDDSGEHEQTKPCHICKGTGKITDIISSQQAQLAAKDARIENQDKINQKLAKYCLELEADLANCQKERMNQ